MFCEHGQSVGAHVILSSIRQMSTIMRPATDNAVCL